jgi:hypothetical protein
MNFLQSIHALINDIYPDSDDTLFDWSADIGIEVYMFNGNRFVSLLCIQGECRSLHRDLAGSHASRRCITFSATRGFG